MTGGGVPLQLQNCLIPEQSTEQEDKGVFEVTSLLPLVGVESKAYFFEEC